MINNNTRYSDGGSGRNSTYLEDDIDVVSQSVQVMEGQFERDSVGVEEGTRLEETEEPENHTTEAK